MMMMMMSEIHLQVNVGHLIEDFHLSLPWASTSVCRPQSVRPLKGFATVPQQADSSQHSLSQHGQILTQNGVYWATSSTRHVCNVSDDDTTWPTTRFGYRPYDFTLMQSAPFPPIFDHSEASASLLNSYHVDANVTECLFKHPHGFHLELCNFAKCSAISLLKTVHFLIHYLHSSNSLNDTLSASDSALYERAWIWLGDHLCACR